MCELYKKNLVLNFRIGHRVVKGETLLTSLDGFYIVSILNNLPVAATCRPELTAKTDLECSSLTDFTSLHL